ncbi:MAG: TonB-dependent receptor [Cyclobacteriaceae bacterium]|nr:TonB-dependent receptor [Cyclobacteriaceae bacterium]
MRPILILFFIFSLLSSYAQKGTIRGSVIEDATGESLIGVTIVFKGTTIGAMTDLDGKFSIDVEPGTHDLQISYVSFQTVIIEGVVVEANKVTVLNDVRLSESTIELQDVVVTAEAIRTTEEALNTLKKKSPSMMDGISASKMQLVGDATAVEAAKRVTGVSIEGGKYIYVRGLGDRYTKTTLNGVDIPGLDPDRNSLQMDIFPTNLIDNMIVSKNFTAELPADFTGGLMNIETKDFPDEKIISFSVSTEYNPQMHLTSDYLSYEGGSKDWLGFDDGSRALPAGADQPSIPTPISGASKEDVFDFVSSYNPQLAAVNQTSLVDYSASFTLGDQITLGKKNNSTESGGGKNNKLGYIFSLSYKNEYRFYDEVFYGEYQRYIDPEVYEMRYATKQSGQLGERNVLIGGLGGLAFKTRFSKFKLMAMHLQNGESRAGKFSIDNDGAAVGQSGYIAASDNLEYNQRSLTNVLLNGTHVLGGSGWEIDWRLSPTLSTSEDPDIRKTAFTQTPTDTSFIAGAGGNPARIWRTLNEVNAIGKLDITKKYTFKAADAKVKFGLQQTYKEREYEILFFDIQFFGGQNWPVPDPALVLNEENLYPNKPNSIYYQSGKNNDPNPNEYQSNITNTAYYISNEMDLFSNFKTILGLRAENYIQRHTGRDQSYASGDFANGRNLDDDIVLKSLDFFPSINLIYSLTKEQNLRASFTKTIARPSFKELSFAQIIDPITNRIFNGSLFKYSDWNGKTSQNNTN